MVKNKAHKGNDGRASEPARRAVCGGMWWYVVVPQDIVPYGAAAQ